MPSGRAGFLRRCFVTPGEGHEKGGVEGKGGYFRRNHLVPVPQVASWEELNVVLLEASKQDEHRLIGERAQTVGAGMHTEREHLRTLLKKASTWQRFTPPYERQRLHPSG